MTYPGAEYMRAWRARNPGKWTEYNVRYQRKYPERHREKVRRLRERHKARLEAKYHATSAFIDSLKASGCVDCGNKNLGVLDFDHVRSKTRMVSAMRTHSWPAIEAEASKCEVRCANCHRVITAARRRK